MTQADSSRPVPVAIIGMGCLFPMAGDLARFWSNIRNKLDTITDIPSTHWRPEEYWREDPKAEDRTYARRGGFLTPVDFPLLDFGIAPHAVEATDTTQLLGLLVARDALNDAGYGPDRDFARDRVSVILGVTGTLELVIPLGARLGHPIWRRALSAAGVEDAKAEEVVKRISESYVGWQENSFPGLLGNVAAGRIANRLDLGGTNCVVDAACASSLGAVNLAMLELAAGRCDVALSGGLDTFNDIFMYMCFSKTPALSPTGDARPFDAGADGTILGEGLGILVLKRLEDARRDGDRIYAVIRAMGTSSDGKGQAVYAPSSAGQVKAIRQAYQLADVAPDSIELVEAHGTGTKVGDAAELEALHEVYRGARRNGRWCALGSIKSQVGHTKAAAGAAGLIKAALALHHKVLPPTIKVSQPIEPLAGGASPFYLNTDVRPWLPARDHPRRAAVSAFGFGGSNFHCLLEESDPASPGIDWSGDVQILAYSGEDADQIRARLPAWDGATAWPDVRLEGARSRAAFRRDHHCRLALVVQRGAADAARLIERAVETLSAAAAGAPARTTSRDIVYASGPPPGLLAMLFPGQGSQYLGMARDLACRFPRAQRALALWDQPAGPAGRRLVDRIYPPSVFRDDERRGLEDDLRDTRVAQPAIGAVSLGLLGVLDEFGIRPDMAGGHSFGELTALHAAGRIDEADLVRLSIRRGALMADSAGSADMGAMLAVFAPLDRVGQCIEKHALDLVIANKNAPGQCVLSGSSAEIDRAEKIFSDDRISCRRLAVSAAFHSGMVAPARSALRRELAEVVFRPARIPVFSNVTAAPYPEAEEEARDLLADQLARPVEFAAQVEAMYGMGARTFLEVGPDSKLTGLVRSILEGKDHAALAVDLARGEFAESNVADLALVLASLAALGYPVELQRWDEGFRAPPPESSRKKLTVKVCGANSAPHASPENGNGRDRAALKTHAAYDRTTMKSKPDHSPGTNGQTSGDYSASPPVLRASATPEPAGRISGSLPTAPPADGSLAGAIAQSQANLVALQRLAEETARLHRQFLEGQADTQRTFQSLLEQQQRLTLATLGQAAAPVVAPVSGPQTRAMESNPAPVRAEVEAAPPEIAVPRPSVNGSGHALTPAAPPKDDSALGSGSASSVLLDVVAEKTGYPVEMLEPDMLLDADLGIDSIKRVEIFSALQDRLPDAPAVKPEHLGSLRTLRQIAEFLGQPDHAPAPSRNGDVQTAAPNAPDVLLQVVAEKTGYPVEMLEPDMLLDADLGIDSIKRVEIFSALQDRLPDAPAVKPEHLGSLRTLRQIGEFLGNTPDEPSRSIGAEPGRNGHAHTAAPDVLLQVVAEKTGYPVEMLEPDMLLDADLGIDSIKRVEIFSALQDRLPDAPVVKPEHLGSLRTLRQVAEFVAGSPPPRTTSEERPSTEVNLRRLVPRAVPLADSAQRGPVALAPAGAIWVTDDGSALSGALCQRLARLGHQIRAIQPGEFEGPSPDEALSGLILLAPQADEEGSWLKNTFRLLRAAGPALRRAGSMGGAALLTVSRLDGAFGLSGLEAAVDPASGALAGLAKTAREEWPEVSCKAVDLPRELDCPETAAEALIAELLAEGPAEVGLSRQGPLRIELEASPREPVQATGGVPRILGRGDLVVISGGARGITAEVAVALAGAYQARLALLGRTQAPGPEPSWLAGLSDDVEIRRAIRDQSGQRATPQTINEQLSTIVAQREIRRNLDRIRAAGAEVSYHPVDVRDPAAVAEVLAEVSRQAGPVRGLVHGAGVLADRRIEDQTEEQFARVLDTKVQGLASLMEAVDRSALRFLALFSSSTARFGRVGQAAYAAANEFLNKWAQREAAAHANFRTIAFNWGPWDGGMVTDALKPLFEREGIGLIPPAEGARLLVEEIEREGPRSTEIVVLAESPAGCSLTVDAPARVQDDHRSNGKLEPVMERTIGLSSLPVIRSHVIDGHAVLPMALILEWLAEGALHRHPGMTVEGVNQLKLFKGVVLRDERPVDVSIRAGKRRRINGSQLVSVEMHGALADGREIIHARGEVMLADKLPGGERTLDAPRALTRGADREGIYRQILFHGPAMQAIRHVEGSDERSISAWVSTSPPPASWLDRPLRQNWLTDPLAIDAAFQVVVLWTRERLGANSLPTAVGSYRQFRGTFPPDGVRVLAVVRQFSDHRALADIEFLDASDQLVARIDSYECVIDPSLNQAFRRNRLALVEVEVEAASS